ncbi:MAG: helix-turn-helix domain-containing protein [Polyangiaceae bacterium]|nr:helix-turn-helix domain-containing protein [Polyangiaceae bacterium]
MSSTATPDLRPHPKVPAILADDDFLTVDDAADYVCRTIRTIRRWGKLGMLPRSRRLGREVYIHRADLDELLKPAWIDGVPSNATAA